MMYLFNTQEGLIRKCFKVAYYFSKQVVSINSMSVLGYGTLILSRKHFLEKKLVM